MLLGPAHGFRSALGAAPSWDKRSARLPLYEDWLAGVNKTLPAPRNPRCRMCGLGERATTVCMPGEGEPGGLLVMHDFLYPRNLTVRTVWEKSFREFAGFRM